MRVFAMASMAGILLLLLSNHAPVLQAEEATPKPFEPPTTSVGSHAIKIGKGYELQHTDILKPGSGLSIFNPADIANCFLETPLKETAYQVSSYESTDEFRKHLADEASLSASYGPVSLQASVKYATSSETTKNLKVAELKGHVYTAEVTLNQDCLDNNPLSASIRKEFEALPIFRNNATVQMVLTDVQLRPYARFFQKAGNHFISGFYFGASYRYYATSTDTAESTAEDLEVKACATVDTGSVSVEGCNTVNQGSSSSSKVSVSSTNVVKVGGDEGGAIGKYAMPQYLKTGETSRTPALYQFTPIWDVLNKIYSDGDSFSRITTLKAYYEGWIDQGCNTLKVQGVEQRRFVLEPYQPGEDMVFKCMWPPTGCRNDFGCAHRWYGSDDRCICCGPDCIVNPKGGSRSQYVSRPRCDSGRPGRDDHTFDFEHNGACPHNTCQWVGG